MKSHPKNKLRILRLITRLNVGGPSIQAIDLSTDVPQWTTRLISGSLKAGEEDMSSYIGKRAIDHRRLNGLVNPIDPTKDLKVIPQLLKEIKEFQPDLIHTHHAKAGLLGRVAGHLARVPTIHTFHGNVFEGHFSPFKSKCILFAEKGLAPLTDALIAISPQQKKDLCGRFFVTEHERVSVIPLGFHLEKFSSFDESKQDLRVQFNLPLDAKLVGIVGRLTHVKNHKFFLKALSQMNPDYHGVIVGDGELKDSLTAYAETLNLSSRLHWIPTTKKIERIYRALDTLAITSHSEGTPVTMIEAMSAGLPVVAAAVGGIPDLVRKEANALLYTPDSQNEFIQKVANCFKNTSETESRIQKARSYTLKEHSFEKLVTSLEALYHKILS